MKKLNKHIVFFIGAISFMLIATATAQKNVDSILVIANKQIYENPDKAITMAQEAYDLPHASVKNKINALLCISTAYSSKRNYEKSSEYVEHIRELFPKIKEPKQKMNILNRVAAHYQELQIYDKAVEYLDQSLSLIEKYPIQDSIQSFLGYNAALRGFIYREKMNCDIAINYFDKAIEAFGNTLDKDIMNANLSICYYNKGNCFLSEEKNAEAKASYLKAIGHAETINAKSLIAFGLKGLAEVKTLEGKYSEAIVLLEEARQISEEVGDLILDRGLYEGLSNNYLALHDYDNYALYLKKFNRLQEATKIAERKSINQSLLYLAEDRANEINQINKWYGPIQICLITSIPIALLFFIRFVLLKEKELKKLQKKLQD